MLLQKSHLTSRCSVLTFFFFFFAFSDNDLIKHEIKIMRCMDRNRHGVAVRISGFHPGVDRLPGYELIYFLS